MTIINRTGYIPRHRLKLTAPPLTDTKDISIVIPVKDNQKGIDRFLTEFEKTHTIDLHPREIIIVDNNSETEIKLTRTYPFDVQLLKCKKVGPASARNKGTKRTKGQWVLFVDSDCIPTKTLLTGHLKNCNRSIAYAGTIKSFGRDIISQYYETQEILIPPKNFENLKNPRPEYLITANCLIWKQAFNIINGFNENISIAGGEDIDLGFRLLEIGQLSYSYDSIAYHDFDDGLKGFKNRFIRYGQGNRIVEQLHSIDLKPRQFRPNKKRFLNYILAYLQYSWLLEGWKTGATFT